MPRPKGSKNKRSQGVPPDLAERLGHRDPAEVLGELYSMPHQALQKLVRSAAGARAVALRVQAATAAMPYVHSKMPVAVTVQDERYPVLIIHRDKHQMQQNQQLIGRAMDAVALPAVAPDGQGADMKGESDE